MRYPHFYELRKGHDEPALNRAIDAELTSLVDQFLPKAREARREGPASTALAPWSFAVRCTPTYYRADAVSVVCKIDEYEGGAHPKQTAIALNFWPLGTAQTFSVDHMFLPGKNHRKVISDLCIAALLRQKAQWVVDGLTDVTKFLHTVNVTATGLLVTFDPYETGPYAEGFHEVAIPWERLRDIIDPSGPIGGIGR